MPTKFSLHQHTPVYDADVRAVVITAIAGTLLSACSSAVAPVVHDPTLVVSDDAAAGAVGVIAMIDPNAPTRRLRDDEEYIPPRPNQENALPRYPAELLDDRLAPQRVGVRFTIDANGHVRDVKESSVARTTEGIPTPFVAAVVSTVQTWCFSPPRVRRFASAVDSDGDGQPDYRSMLSEESISILYDLQFTFEVVDGRGVVRTGE